MNLLKNETLVTVGGITLIAVIAAWMLKRAVVGVVDAGGRAATAVVDTAAGVATGNNAITKSATNFDGERTTAYEGKGVLGTMGAATNAVLGGLPATFGEWLGGKAYDLTHSDPVAGITPANGR